MLSSITAPISTRMSHSKSMVEVQSYIRPNSVTVIILGYILQDRVKNMRCKEIESEKESKE